MILIGLPFVILAGFVPDSPFNFDWVLGWIGGVFALELTKEE